MAVETSTNNCRATAINLNVCPKVLLTRMHMDFKNELSFAFGDYCEVYNGMDNTLEN
jgi:hypothetical protein